MKMLDNFTRLLDSSPPGSAHDRFVTLLERKIHDAHGGATTKSPPGRVFHTWAGGGEVR